MSLGWAAEAAPAGGMDAVQKLIEQRMQMARDAEVVRSNMAHEQQAKDQLTETTALRTATQADTQATHRAATADKQADMFPRDTPVGPADQQNWKSSGLGGLLRTRPLDATPLPAATVPAMVGGLSTPPGGETAPAPGGPAVMGTLQATQIPTTPVPGQPGDALSIPTQKNQLAEAELGRKTDATNDTIAARTSENQQRQLDRETLARLTASLRPSPQPQMFVNPADGTQHAVMFQNGRAVEIPLPTSGLQKVGGAGSKDPAAIQQQRHNATNVLSHVADIEAEAQKINQLGLMGPVGGRWGDFMAGTIGAGELAAGNPEAAELLGEFRTDVGLLKSGMAMVHGGARGGGSTGMAARMDALISSKTMDLPLFLGATKTFKKWLKTYAEDGKDGGGGGTVAMTAPDGRALDVPPDKVAAMEAAGAKRVAK